MTSRRRAIAAALAALGAFAGSIIAAAPTDAAPRFTTVIPGLNAPRGVAFDGHGNLYVSEAGVAGQGDFGLTHSGRVSKYAKGSSRPAWQTGFESAYVTETPGQPPDVIGPSGISAVGTDCMKHGHGRHTDCSPVMIMGESHDGIAAATGGAINTQQMGHLYRFDSASGRASDRADVGDQQYAWTDARKDLFPDDFPDSNPYGVLVTNGRHGGTRTFVADAGANTISEIMPNGTTRVIAFIPNETQPPFRDATPTCIAQGPDGMLYVATLHIADLSVNGPGGAAVWRVNPNANYPTAPTLWATGLTTPTACTFDRAGNFWATEMFEPTSGAPGDLIRIPFRHPDRLTHLGGGMLPLPGGVAQGPDGAMYVSVNSASPEPGSGAIVRVRG